AYRPDCLHLRNLGRRFVCWRPSAHQRPGLSLVLRTRGLAQTGSPHALLQHLRGLLGPRRPVPGGARRLLSLVLWRGRRGPSAGNPTRTALPFLSGVYPELAARHLMYRAPPGRIAGLLGVPRAGRRTLDRRARLESDYGIFI